MKPCVVVVDMIVDNLMKEDGEERRIVEPLKGFLEKARDLKIPVIFACDSFVETDFIFKGRMKKHAIRGTEGVRPYPELGPYPTDIVLEKRRFSAFFKTDLDQTLRTLGVDTVLLCGINTHFCVLATAFDALANDFEAIILEDLCAAFKREIHERTLDLYRNTALYPLFRVMKSEDFLREYQGSPR